MALSDWLMLASVCIAGALSPGPSLLFVLDTRARHGRSAAFLASLGHGLGVGVYAVAAVLGVAAVAQTHPLLARSIEWAGAAYLLWLAWNIWPRSSGENREGDSADRHAASMHHRSFIAGFLVAILNPKVMLFFAGIFAALAPATASRVELAGMGAMAAVVDASWYALVSYLGGALSQFFARCTVQRMIAALLAAFALALLVP